MFSALQLKREPGFNLMTEVIEMPQEQNQRELIAWLPSRNIHLPPPTYRWKKLPTVAFQQVQEKQTS